jgi:hypothetical protein
LYAHPNRDQITWQQFRDSFRAHHVPEGLRTLKKKEFLSLKQEGMSVMAYRDKFIELSRYAQEEVTIDRKRQARFRDGLRDELQLQLMCIMFGSFHQLVDGALMVEHKRQEIENKKRKFMNQQAGSSTRPRFNPQMGNQLNQQRFQGQSSLLNRNQNQQRPSILFPSSSSSVTFRLRSRMPRLYGFPRLTTQWGRGDAFTVANRDILLTPAPRKIRMPPARTTTKGLDRR